MSRTGHHPPNTNDNVYYKTCMIGGYIPFSVRDKARAQGKLRQIEAQQVSLTASFENRSTHTGAYLITLQLCT